MTKKVGALLSEPLGSTARSEVKFWRSEDVTYRNASDPFVLPAQKSFQRQYFHVYRTRLSSLRDRVVAAAKDKFGKNIGIKNLCDLDEEQTENPEKILVVGTLFKHQPLKPNILKELSEDNDVSLQPILNRQKYISPEDEIILEDDLQRIKLLPSEKSSFDMSVLTTGVVCGVLGRIGSSGTTKSGKNNGGKFFVDDIVFPKTPSSPKPDEQQEDKYLALLSGLNFSGGLSSDTCEHLGALELASSWIVGEGGEVGDQEHMSKVERVILAGNSVAADTKDRDHFSKAKYLTKNQEASSIEAIKALDDFLVQLADSVQVDLMPGRNDPAMQIFPQQPLHQCLFPQSSVYPTFQSVTNPYQSRMAGGLTVLGTSGQNVEDVIQNTSLTDPLEVLESLLRWGHIAPTCPDTLGCYPYGDKDPFVLSQKPSIFFAANQDKLDHKIVENDDGSNTLLVSVPEFSKSHNLTLINMKDLTIESIEFEAKI